MSYGGWKIVVARHNQKPWISFDGGSSFAAESTAEAVAWNSFSMSLDGTTIVGGAGGSYIHISRDSGSSWSVVDPAGGPMAGKVSAAPKIVR